MTPEEKIEQGQGFVPRTLNINQVQQEFDKSQPILRQLFDRYHPEPTRELTEEQQRKARWGATLSDSFASLAEMAGHRAGAHVRNRQGKSAVATTNDRLQEMERDYQKRLLQHNSGRFNADYQDFNNLLALMNREADAHNAAGQMNWQRGNQLADMSTQRAWHLDDRNNAQNFQREMMNKSFANQAQRDAEHRNFQLQGGTQVGSRGSTRSGVKQIDLTPNLNNGNNGLVDTFSGQMRRVNISDAEFNFYLEQAMNDEAFKQNNLGLFQVKEEKDRRGRVLSRTATRPININTVVRAYMQMIEDTTGFDASHFDASTHQGIIQQGENPFATWINQ